MIKKAFVSVFLLLPIISFGETVYTQTPNAALPFYGSAEYINPSDPGGTWTLDSDSQSWDNFAIKQTSSVSRIDWFGSAADASGSFDVKIYTSNLGCEAGGINRCFGSSVYATPDILSTSISGLANKVSLGNGLYQYHIDLASPITLNSGYYLISILNRYTNSPFTWASSNSGTGRDGFHADFIVGRAIYLNAANDLAFILSNGIAAVPLPTTAWLFCSASVGIIGISKRRKPAAS